MYIFVSMSGKNVKKRFFSGANMYLFFEIKKYSSVILFWKQLSDDYKTGNNGYCQTHNLAQQK